MTATDRSRLIRRVHPRDPQEAHRAATPLELFTDLCFVVAVAQAAVSLHHAISHGETADGALHFAMAFFAIFWAWLNFTSYSTETHTSDSRSDVRVEYSM